MLVQLAKRENVPVHILVVTDGRMGYCSLAEREQICRIRRLEAHQCYHKLGVPEENIHWIGLPDCRLNDFRGRRPAEEGENGALVGYNGLQNAFTYYLRQIRPTQCFLPTSSDLHPDHRIVHEEFLISVFHSTGTIWPELGQNLSKPPYIHEIACYCNFPTTPNLQINTDRKMLETKLEAIAAFKSQRQIKSLIEIIRKAGPQEYCRALQFRLYNPNEYSQLFKEGQDLSFLR